MIIPKISPKIPSMATVEPNSGAPVVPLVPPKLEIAAPIKAWKMPPINTKIPPIRAKTKAAVGLSPISDQSQRGSDSIYNVFRSRRISAILAKFGDFFRF